MISRKRGQVSNARISIVLPLELKERYVAEAEKRHWTLTTLIEVALENYLGFGQQINEPKYEQSTNRPE